MNREQFRSKIEVAKKRLAHAEEAMASGLLQLEPAALADTTMISGVLRIALTEITVAKTELIELQELIAPED